ncbi:hypothetical protein LCGC14_0461020 [marine sediment metagenome]|uniref:Large polyvalent protein associated domain-containing protein n=1 Tax=marine sediment metagenome TaxID=412755 RepID=A0A0F9SF55_9ZZZZ|nr:hypothetical protein [bacterium]
MAFGQDYWDKIFGRPPGEALLDPGKQPPLVPPVQLTPQKEEPPAAGITPWENIFGRPPEEELEPIKEESFLTKALGKIGGFLKKETLPFLMQDPGLRGALLAGVPKPEEKEEEKPLPTIGPQTPGEIEFQKKYGRQYEVATRPRSYYRVAQEVWSRDPNVNYWSEKIAGKAVPVVIAATVPGAAGYMALYELFQQMKNIGFSVSEKTEYDPLENRRLSEAIPGIRDAPWWVRLATDLGETGLDIIAAAITGRAISYKAFKFGFNKWTKGMKAAGVDEETLTAVKAKFNEVGKDLSKFSGLDKNIKNIFSKFKMGPVLSKETAITVPGMTAAETAAATAAGKLVPRVPFVPGKAAIPAVEPTPPVPIYEDPLQLGKGQIAVTPKPEVILPGTDPAVEALAVARSGIFPEPEPEIRQLGIGAFDVTTKPEVIPPGTDPIKAAIATARQGITPEIEAAPAVNIKPMPDGSIDVSFPREGGLEPPVTEGDRIFKVQAADLAERLKAGAPPAELAREAHELGIPVSYLPEGITEEGMVKSQAEFRKRMEAETGREIKALTRRETATYQVEGVGPVKLPVRVVSGRRWPKPVPYEWFRVLQYTDKGIKPIKGEEEEALRLDRRLKSRTGEAADEVAAALGYDTTSELYDALELPRERVIEEPIYTETEVISRISTEDVARTEDIEREIARGVSEMEELDAMPEIEKKLTPDAREFLDDYIAKQTREVDREEVLIEAEKISIKNKNKRIMGKDVSEALERQQVVQDLEDLPELDLIQETAIPGLEKEPFKRFIYLGHKWFNDNAKAAYAPDSKVYPARALKTNQQVEKDFGIDLYRQVGAIQSRDALSRELRSLWRDREAGITPKLIAPLPKVREGRRPWAATTTPVKRKPIVPKFGKPAPKQLGLVEREPDQLELEAEKVLERITGKPTPPTPPTVPKKEKAVKVSPKKERLVKVSVETPLGDIEKLGEIPESRLKSIEDYAKKLGIGKKLKVGAPFVGKYGEILSPAQQEIFMKEVIRDVKKKPKSEWQKWTEPGDDIKDLYAGIPVTPEVKKFGEKMVRWLQIEPEFRAMGADRTGLALKALHPRTNAVLLQAKGSIKKLMSKKQNFTPGFTDSDYQRLLFIVSAPRRHFEKMTPAERAKFEPAAKFVRGFFDHWGREIQKKGIIDDLWPQSAVRFMNIEIADFEAALKRRGLSNKRGKEIRDKINKLKGAIEFLRKSGTKYVHIPKFWMEAWWAKDPIEGWKTLSEFFHRRKSLDLEEFAKELIKQGKIKPTDLDIRRVMAAYAHLAGAKLAIADVFRAAKADRLILPSDEAPETWQSLSPVRYPSLKGYRAHPVLVHFFERNFFKQSFMSPRLGGFLGLVKMLQFYNPGFLPFYDAIQYFWLGLLSPWRTPSAIRSAAISMKKKDQHYWNMHYWGGFSTPFTPGWKAWDKQINDIINSKSAFTRFKKLNPYFWAWEGAWWGDNLIRLVTYHHQLSQGATPIEAAQITARLHGDYASIPPATRKIINKILFTPSFRIAMISAQAEMVKNAAGLLFKAKKEAQDGGKLPPGDLFEEPIDGSIPEGPGRSKRYKRAMAKALIGLLGGMLLREIFMHKLGYKTDKFGLRYVKTVTSEGEEKELVQYMSSPDNVLLRYWHRFRTLANEPDKLKGMIDRAKWDFHPFWQLIYEVLANRDPAGEPIYRPGLESSAKIGTEILEYSIKRILRILELVSEETPGKRKLAIEAMYRDMGKLGHFFRWFTLPYLRNTEEKRMMWRMNFMMREFNRLQREKPFDTEKQSKEAASRVNEFLKKMQKDIEEKK